MFFQLHCPFNEVYYKHHDKVKLKEKQEIVLDDMNDSSNVHVEETMFFSLKCYLGYMYVQVN